MNGKNLRSGNGINTSLTAAALQDHLSQQLSLSLAKPSIKSRHHNSSKKTKPCSHHCKNQQQFEEDVESLDSEATRTEYVLDASPAPLSLAQRMGLIDRPSGLLTSSEWCQVKKTSRKRQDSTLPCPICREEFGLKQQVLLSCSHVFHRQCLQSVERFGGNKICPLCRCKDYQTRIIYDGEIHYRNKAATVIQAWWRGLKMEKWYKLYREKVPPIQPSLRNKYYQKKLKSITSQMVKSCDQSRSNADCVLAAADSALSIARNTMRMLDHHSTAIDWQTLHTKAKQITATAECSICICPLQAPPTSHAHHHHRPISLLSCGHVFHYACVCSLEHYCTNDTVLPLCPLCRAPYIRQQLQFC